MLQYPQLASVNVLEWGSFALLVVALLYFVRAQTGSQLRGFARLNPIKMVRPQSYGVRGAQHLDQAKRWAVLALTIAVFAYAIGPLELVPKVLPGGQLAGADGKPISEEQMARALKMSAFFAMPALFFIATIGCLIAALVVLYNANHHRTATPWTVYGIQTWNPFRRTGYTQLGSSTRRIADRCFIFALTGFLLFLVSLGLFKWFTLNFLNP